MIRVVDLVKQFRFFAHPRDALVATLTNGRRGRSEVFTALDRVSFEVGGGGTLGIVGPNGAGKSTLLRILAGTLYPTSGEVVIEGRIAALLELGTGFHPDFTGRENAILNAGFLGLDEAEVAARLPEILSFAELGSFIDRPLRTYSSGMKMRLGFAVAASVSPDVLLVDEALSVGDAYFQQKCVRRMREFRERGVATLLVTHDFAAVKTLCDEALFLEGGRIVARGPTTLVLERYNASIARRGSPGDPPPLGARMASSALRDRRFGSFEAVIAALDLYDAEGRSVREIPAGDRVEIRVRIYFFAALSQPTVGILIRDRLGHDAYGTNTFYQRIDTGTYAAGEAATVSFFLALDLGAGDYTVTAAVHSFESHVQDSYDWIDRYLAFRVLPPATGQSIGTALLRPRVEVGGREGPLPPSPSLLADLFDGGRTTLSMTDPELVSGWYPLEGRDGEVFRWTQDAFAFVIALAGERLCFEAATDRPHARPVRAALRVGAEAIGDFAVTPGAPFSVLSVELPAVHDRGLQAVVVRLSDGWCPRESGDGDDDRRLGLRVRRIWVE